MNAGDLKQFDLLAELGDEDRELLLDLMAPESDESDEEADG